MCAKLASVDRVSKIPKSCAGFGTRIADASSACAVDGSESSTTMLAPNDWTKDTSFEEAVEITRTPDAVASWMARAPIDEAPLMMRIVCSSSASSCRLSDDRARGKGRSR